MSGEQIGLWGGLAGAILGVVGGLIGTYFSIKNTKGPKECAFMVRLSIYIWSGITLFIVLLLLLPKHYNFLMWIPYSIFLLFVIKYCNQNQTKIREEES